MELIYNIISWIKKFGQPNKQGKPRANPESLSADTMAKVMDEVRFLRGEHAVDVKNLEAGEKPGAPKRADLQE